MLRTQWLSGKDGLFLSGMMYVVPACVSRHRKEQELIYSCITLMLSLVILLIGHTLCGLLFKQREFSDTVNMFTLQCI